MNDSSAFLLAPRHDPVACRHDSGQVIDELTYRCYAHNRGLRPDIAPERWRALFGDRVPLLELRYQADLLLAACGNRPLAWTAPARPVWSEDDAAAAAEWTNLGPGYGEE